MKALFLDRDGIMNTPPKKENGGYLTKPSEFEFQMGIVDFLKICSQKKILLLIATNQQCIGKGILDISGLNDIHNHMLSLLALENIFISKIYFCPHLSSENCDCRKPKPGLLVRGMKDYNLKPEECGFLGDSKTDVLAGINAGIKKNFYYKTKEEDLSDLAQDSIIKISKFIEIEPYLKPVD